VQELDVTIAEWGRKELGERRRRRRKKKGRKIRVHRIHFRF